MMHSIILEVTGAMHMPDQSRGVVEGEASSIQPQIYPQFACERFVFNGGKLPAGLWDLYSSHRRQFEASR